MNDSALAPIGCMECQLEGRRGVLMTYRGSRTSRMPVAVSVTDDSATGGVRVFDQVMEVPFDVWRCDSGHEYTDGY